jgi:endoglycosylceramidase
VREVDEDAWLFFESRYGAPGNGSPSFLPKLRDPRAGEDRLVYAPHLYSVSLEATHSYAPSDRTVEKWEASRTAELATLEAPLVMGEWGLDLGTEDAERFVDDVLALADRMLSGWAYWSYDPSSWGPVLGDGTDAWSVDHMVRPYPRAVAGTPVSFGYDASTRTFTLEIARRRGVGGATEIHVPSRAYPDGYEVEVSDADGTWSSTYDVVQEVLSLTLDPSEPSHTVVIRPAAP